MASLEQPSTEGRPLGATRDLVATERRKKSREQAGKERKKEQSREGRRADRDSQPHDLRSWHFARREPKVAYKPHGFTIVRHAESGSVDPMKVSLLSLV